MQAVERQVAHAQPGSTENEVCRFAHEPMSWPVEGHVVVQRACANDDGKAPARVICGSDGRVCHGAKTTIRGDEPVPHGRSKLCSTAGASASLQPEQMPVNRCHVFFEKLFRVQHLPSKQRRDEEGERRRDEGGKGGWEDEGGREVLFFSCAPSSLLFFARAPSLSPLLGPARYGAHGSAP